MTRHRLECATRSPSAVVGEPRERQPREFHPAPLHPIAASSDPRLRNRPAAKRVGGAVVERHVSSSSGPPRPARRFRVSARKDCGAATLRCRTTRGRATMTEPWQRSADAGRRLEGRVALVTGAGAGDGLMGIGAATAVLFATQGAQVGVVDISPERAEADAADDRRRRRRVRGRRRRSHECRRQRPLHRSRSRARSGGSTSSSTARQSSVRPGARSTPTCSSGTRRWP